MNQKNVYKQMITMSIVIFLAVVSLSGCVTDQNTGGGVGKFIGSWTGDMQTSLLGGRGNTSITQLTFTENVVKATLESDQGTLSMNYTYKVENNKLVLEPQFLGGRGLPGGQPFNGTRPPWNDTQPPNNSTWPPNGTQPPFNGSGQPPDDRQRPSMSMSFEYSFNEQKSILYLNGFPFNKMMH